MSWADHYNRPVANLHVSSTSRGIYLIKVYPANDINKTRVYSSTEKRNSNL